MKILFFMLASLLTLLSAAELISKTQLLKAGDSMTFYPQKGESVAVTKDFLHYDEDANFNIVMKNGQRVYFENRNQQDDMYIIFNESTDPGDAVFLKVNKGSFTYTTESFDTLPQPVKKVLKASLKRKKHHRKEVSAANALITQEEFCFDGMGNVVDCPSSPVKREPAESSRQSVPEQKEVVKNSKPKEDSEGFFAAFSQKLKGAFQKITQTLKTPKKEDEPKKQPVTVKSKSDESSIANKIEIKKHIPVKAEKRDISKYNNLSDQELIAGSRLKVPEFHTLPKTDGIVEEFDRMAFAPKPSMLQTVSEPIVNQKVQKTTLSQPQYQKPIFAGTQKFAPSDHLDYRYQKPGYSKDVQPALRESAKRFAKTDRPQLKAESAKFQAPETPAFERSMKPVVGGKSQIPMDSTLPKSQATVAKPAFASKPDIPVVEREIGQSSSFAKREMPVLRNAPPSDTAQIIQEHIVKPAMKPTPLPQSKVPEPVVVQTPKTEEKSAPADKIVITKIINKKQKQTETAPLERMSDRVLGGGYSEQLSMGQVGVKAYSNRKPVSAWVEVFKGKRRVKTFYTSAGKLIKLPAGTYVMKATYRTGSSKQRKNLGRVQLHEGDTIHKKVYFNVGRLVVVAQRKGKPLYVKIEIYQKGSRRRYAYTFSSRRTGKAHLQLGEGRYRIVVLEHGDKKVFDNVYIKGNSSKTLRVEF